MTEAPETVADALRWATQRLRESGVEEAALDAELLLAHILGQSRAQLRAHPQRCLSDAEQADLARLVERRAGREPLAYILGHREFYGLDFYVDRRVLIPRPESELLVELALAYAHSWPGDASLLRIADVGTGSGAVALALARHLPQARVYGLDASAEALVVAARNRERLALTERVTLLQGDLLDPLPERVHLLVANLPYISEGEWDALAPEIREHEPTSALLGGLDGLEVIRRLLAQARDYLAPGAALQLEIGEPQGAAALALGRRAFPEAEVRVERDYAGLDRVLVVRLPSV